ncbi:hypothetical protein GmHk_04G010916 [Glycine max]|nr:hypothetical protein GmHk_04G010916 [Glycine max]
MRFSCGSGSKPTTFSTHINGGSLNDQTGGPKATIRVFTLNGAEASKSKDLIQGKCFISGIPLLVLFNFGATHSFISCLCVEKLKLSMPFLNNDLEVETPTSRSVLTFDVSIIVEWRRRKGDWRRHFKENMSQEQAHHHRKSWIRA